MDILNNYLQLWNDLTTNQSDKRTRDWFMMSSPVPSILICVFYVIFVFIGIHFMKQRKEPFKINDILIFYNFTMVILSGYMFYEFLINGWLFDYSFRCQPVDYSDSPKALRMANVCWLFYISKFVELLDTVFFIMRKKFNQVTFLHVFHHGIMPCTWWFGIRFVPGGFGSFHALINSFIHFVMYAYYGLAALGPEYQKYLWWKKYMTKMQMIQFILVMIHSAQLFFIECDYPKFFSIWICSYAIIFMIFFTNFYIQEYIYRRNKKAALIKKD